jgi:hypothetical protein
VARQVEALTKTIQIQGEQIARMDGRLRNIPNLWQTVTVMLALLTGVIGGTGMLAVVFRQWMLGAG